MLAAKVSVVLHMNSARIKKKKGDERSLYFYIAE